ncbi:hypothetical protein D9613_000077 [Agrocybe pediades]|uniref:C2H2-type domain-containing protein n=1 Tax=Agrocybe pediades TaxID=84607 RepID=A0A8H4VU01_9AGAR|nr:hypothetical protein D9613_000077 [Agrocybe pediades]
MDPDGPLPSCFALAQGMSLKCWQLENGTHPLPCERRLPSFWEVTQSIFDQAFWDGGLVRRPHISSHELLARHRQGSHSGQRTTNHHTFPLAGPSKLQRPETIPTRYKPIPAPPSPLPLPLNTNYTSRKIDSPESPPVSVPLTRLSPRLATPSTSLLPHIPYSTYFNKPENSSECSYKRSSLPAQSTSDFKSPSEPPKRQECVLELKPEIHTQSQGRSLKRKRTKADDGDQDFISRKARRTRQSSASPKTRTFTEKLSVTAAANYAESEKDTHLKSEEVEPMEIGYPWAAKMNSAQLRECKWIGEDGSECSFKVHADIWALVSHIEEEHAAGKLLDLKICKFCGKKLSQVDPRKTHENTQHTGATPYHCMVEGCTMRYGDSSQRNEHYRKVHKDQCKDIIKPRGQKLKSPAAPRNAPQRPNLKKPFSAMRKGELQALAARLDLSTSGTVEQLRDLLRNHLIVNRGTLEKDTEYKHLYPIWMPCRR